MLLKASRTTLLFLLCFGFAIFAGCKSVEFERPKLPSLAFWKKGEAELPPPPARHFDPSRLGNEAEIQVAESQGSATKTAKAEGSATKGSATKTAKAEGSATKGSATKTAKAQGSATKGSASKVAAAEGSATKQLRQPEFDQYGIRIKDGAKKARNVASKGFEFPKESLDKLENKPIRKPYKLDDLDSAGALAKAENQLNLDSANLKNRFDSAKSTASNQLSTAQQDFRAAMNSTGSSSKSAASNAFAVNDNSFAANPIAKTADTVAKGLGSISGGSFTPASNAFSNVKQASATTAANINKTLYDAKGNLQSTASKISNNLKDVANANGSNALKSEFEQRLLAAQKRAQTNTESFKTNVAGQAKKQLNALANVSERTKNLINKPFPKVAADGSFIPQKSSPVDLSVGQPALQPSKNSLLPIGKPNALASNSFAESAATNDTVAKMRLEAEAAKRQIAELKAQIAAAKRPDAAAVTKPVQRVAQNQNTIEGFVLPLERVSNAYDPKAGSPVASQANQFQGKSFSPAASPKQAPLTPQYKSNTGGGSNSFYPSTPYGGFGATKKPKATVGQVGFNSANDFQNRVSQANAETPVNSNSSGIPQASRIDSSVGEVLIPSSILSGSSSFTPGSTNPLR